MKKILIIEDDRILMETASDFLKEEGFEVIPAYDGSEGVHAAETSQPDLILCDIYMPNIDGYQVFAKLQSGIQTSQIPFIFMTAKAGKEDVRYGMQLGADDYITKPFNFPDLKITIQARLDKFEKTIKKSEAKYRALFELASDAILMLKPPEGILVEANQAAYRLLGFSKEELLEKNGSDIMASGEFNQIQQQWKAGEKQDSLFISETDWIHKNGEMIPVQVSATRIELHGEIFFLLIARNITDIKAKETALRESEERHRDLVENTGEGLGVVDLEETFTFANPAACEIFGLTHEEMIGKSLLDFLEPGSREEVMQQTQIRKKGEKSIYEMEVVRPDGQPRWIIVTATPQFDAAGHFTGTFGIFRDITKRKLYEKELIVAKEKAEESDRLKSSILANISHELRTPLNGILGFAEILREELRDTEYEKMVENIYSSGHRLMITLNSIITLSQLEAGKIPMSLKAFNLEQGITSVIKSMKPLAEQKAITIQTFGMELGAILTDEHLFKLLLRQLVDNAIKFTEKGGIIVETHKINEPPDEWLIVKVTDTGIGIEKDYYELIFQEFRQVSEGFGRRYQGSGIGLTICKKIIDLLNGKITLESEPGKGSTFSIWLPLRSPEKSVAPSQDIKEEKGITVKKPKNGKMSLPIALIVEDNPVNKDLTEFFLKKICQVEHAFDGLTALSMARSKQYSVILMDINLGAGKTGIEVTREIRKIPGYEKVPIIAVTGYTMVEDREKLLEEGCTHYLPKPFDQASLLNLVEAALSENEQTGIG